MDNFGHLFGLFRCNYEHITPETMMQSADYQQVTAKGYRVTAENEPKRAGATLKKFFFIKFTRSVCEGMVGIALRGRVADGVLVVENA